MQDLIIALSREPEFLCCFNRAKAFALTLKEHGKSANRVTFLIDPEGVARAVWPKVKVDGHAEKVLTRLEELVGGAKG